MAAVAVEAGLYEAVVVVDLEAAAEGSEEDTEATAEAMVHPGEEGIEAVFEDAVVGMRRTERVVHTAINWC